MKEYFEIGQIVNTHGLKGYVKVVPYTDDIQRFSELKRVYIRYQKKLVEFDIEKVKYLKNMVSLKLAGIENINEAEKYKGCYLVIKREDARKLEKDTYFIADLIGSRVVDDQENLLGILEDIYNTGSNDIYVVQTSDGKQILIPAIKSAIYAIDVNQKKIVVNQDYGRNWSQVKIHVLTLFPEMFTSLQFSILGRAMEQNLLQMDFINMRDYSEDKHKKVDDTPYGGGAGMVIRPDIVFRAYSSIQNPGKVIHMSPRGKVLTNQMAKDFAKEEEFTILCGHYEGIDERVIEEIVDEEVSVGDYVLTGGELPAMVLIDTVARYVEGVINHDSVEEESFANGLLEYPQYTRPETFLNKSVPKILLSGHHANIKKWRRQESLKITLKNRPDLLQAFPLSDDDKKYLEELRKANKS